MVTVTKVDDTTFDVTVEGKTTTTHHVTVDDAVYRRLTGGKVTPEELIRQSFEFLLEREPNTSILRRFDLTVISNYFPEYEADMKSRFA